MSTKSNKACGECGIPPPGHKIDCRTGNDRARAYQAGLVAAQRRRPAKPMFTVFEAAAWKEMTGYHGKAEACLQAMERAVELLLERKLKKAARAAAKALFTAGGAPDAQYGTQLRIMKDEKYLGGWCVEAVECTIEDAVKNSLRA